MCPLGPSQAEAAGLSRNGRLSESERIASPGMRQRKTQQISGWKVAGRPGIMAVSRTLDLTPDRDPSADQGFILPQSELTVGSNEHVRFDHSTICQSGTRTVWVYGNDKRVGVHLYAQLHTSFEETLV